MAKRPAPPVVINPSLVGGLINLIKGKKMDSDDWYAGHGLAPAGTKPYGKTEMKLGDKLKKTLEELEQARIKGLEAQAAADMEAIRRVRADLEDWLDHTRTHLVSQIEAGKVPLKKVTDYTRQQWLRDANKGVASNHDLWSKFRQFWISEGLEPVLEEAHDGMGRESWINLTVKVLPARPRNFASGGAYEG
jgi:hypothetical protein